MIGGEGVAGLVLPMLVGVGNDRYARTVAGRLFLVLLAAPILIAALLAVATDLGPVVLIAGASGYFVSAVIFPWSRSAWLPSCRWPVVSRTASGTLGARRRFDDLRARAARGGVLPQRVTASTT